MSEQYDEFWRRWAGSKTLETGFVECVYALEDPVEHFRLYAKPRHYSLHSYFAFAEYMSDLHRIWRRNNR